MKTHYYCIRGYDIAPCAPRNFLSSTKIERPEIWSEHILFWAIQCVPVYCQVTNHPKVIRSSSVHLPNPERTVIIWLWWIICYKCVNKIAKVTLQLRNRSWLLSKPSTSFLVDSPACKGLISTMDSRSQLKLPSDPCWRYLEASTNRPSLSGF